MCHGPVREVRVRVPIDGFVGVAPMIRGGLCGARKPRVDVQCRVRMDARWMQGKILVVTSSILITMVISMICSCTTVGKVRRALRTDGKASINMQEDAMARAAPSLPLL